MSHNPPLIFIYGPTGVGKSNYAIALSKLFPVEIVNCDVGQFYTPLSIGTAKPNWKQEPVPHHLFDILDEPKNYTVVEYKKALITTCHKIWSKGKIPIVVGGSGFYLKSLFFSPHKESLASVEVSMNYADEKTGILWERLFANNPERAKAIHPHDRYRIERALSMTALHKPSAASVPQYEIPDFSYLIFCFTRKREDLYQLINDRTKKMIEDGWIKEVEQLEELWGTFLKQKKLIGYDVIIKALEQRCEDPEVLIPVIAQKTRHYAKRQMTFWRMLKKALEPHCTAPNALHEIMLDDTQGSFNTIKEIVMKFLISLRERGSL